MADEKDQNEGLGWGVLSLPDRMRHPPPFVAAIIYGICGLIILAILAIGISILGRVLVAAFNFENLKPIETADEFNKILLGLGGLIGAVTVVPFLVWRAIIAQKQNTLAQENLHSTTMAKAIEQLGAMKEEKITKDGVDVDGKQKSETLTNSKPNIEVRLGAIYLLEKLAREHEQLHWPIMEILCAYVRENAGPPQVPPEDVIAAYAAGWHVTQEQKELLAKRKKDLQPPRVDIQAAITVIGRRSAKQKDWEKQFAAVNNRADRLDLSYCQLAKVKCNGLDFSHADFQGSSLEYAHLIQAHLEEAYLSGAHLGRANLTRAHLEGAYLGGAHLEGVNLFAAHLEGADLEMAHLEGAGLICAHLEGADLSEAYLEGAYLQSAHLEDANIGNADLGEAKYVTQEMINKTWGDADTRLPEGIKRPGNERWEMGESDDNYDGEERWQERHDYWVRKAKERASEEAGD